MSMSLGATVSSPRSLCRLSAGAFAAAVLVFALGHRHRAQRNEVRMIVENVVVAISSPRQTHTHEKSSVIETTQYVSAMSGKFNRRYSPNPNAI